jgi:hypothetical protein
MRNVPPFYLSAESLRLLLAEAKQRLARTAQLRATCLHRSGVVTRPMRSTVVEVDFVARRKRPVSPDPPRS